jgi:hypothetical protein
MARVMAMIWYWSLILLPFTMILTFILTLVVCSQVLHNPRPKGKLPEISLLGVDSAYYYFLSGFILLFVQILLIIIGRLQFLFQSQSIIHRAILYAIHATALISSIFLLIMAIVNVDDRPRLHIIGAIGMFAFLSSYCILHTIVAIYLFIKRSEAPEYSNIFWPLWFLVCSILLIIFFSIWGAKSQPIPQYIASTMPFLYILGFIPQFWRQAKMKRQNAA